MSTEKALTTPVDTAAGIVAVIERAAPYQNRLLDMWESGMKAGIPADAKWHLEWLFAEEFNAPINSYGEKK